MTKNPKTYLMVVVLIVAMNITSGCTHCTLKIYDVQQPVMLGNIQQIGGGNVAHGGLESNLTISSDASAWNILLPFGDFYLPQETSQRHIVIRDLSFRTSHAVLLVFPSFIIPIGEPECKIKLRSSIYTDENPVRSNRELKQAR